MHNQIYNVFKGSHFSCNWTNSTIQLIRISPFALLDSCPNYAPCGYKCIKNNELNRDGGAKRYANNSSRENNRRNASLHFTFKQQDFYEKCIGMHLVCYFPYYSCLRTFWPTIPTSSIYLNTCLCPFV